MVNSPTHELAGTQKVNSPMRQLAYSEDDRCKLSWISTLCVSQNRQAHAVGIIRKASQAAVSRSDDKYVT